MNLLEAQNAECKQQKSIVEIQNERAAKCMAIIGGDSIIDALNRERIEADENAIIKEVVDINGKSI